MTKIQTFAFVAAMIAVAHQSAGIAHAAPLGYTGGTITENFDTLPTNVTNAAQTGLPKAAFYLNPAVNNLSGLTGWQGNNLAGSSGTSEFRSQDGSLASGNGRGIISFGTNGSTDRALGALATSNQINAFGLVLLNNSQSTYTGFDVSFVGEQWRRGEPGVNNTVTFAYGVAANIDAAGLINDALLSFTNPNTQSSPTEVALNGNLPANQVAKSGTVSGISWAPGQTLVLRWTGNDVSGQDNGLAIDNFSFTANPVPEPSTMVLAGTCLAGAALVALRRRARNA